jgi:hypothetical protein
MLGNTSIASKSGILIIDTENITAYEVLYNSADNNAYLNLATV